jgi:hypothetical protein
MVIQGESELPSPSRKTRDGENLQNRLLRVAVVLVEAARSWGGQVFVWFIVEVDEPPVVCFVRATGPHRDMLADHSTLSA